MLRSMHIGRNKAGMFVTVSSAEQGSRTVKAQTRFAIAMFKCSATAHLAAKAKTRTVENLP